MSLNEMLLLAVADAAHNPKHNNQFIFSFCQFHLFDFLVFTASPIPTIVRIFWVRSRMHPAQSLCVSRQNLVYFGSTIKYLWRDFEHSSRID